MDHETWVICSTIGPHAAREAADILTAAGAAVIDAPVTGGVPGAEQGTLLVPTAGDGSAIDALRGLLSVLGEVALVGERPGDGQATKLVNQLCSSVHLVAAAEAIAFATHLGLDPVKAIGVIRGVGALWFLDERGPRMAELGRVPEVLTRLRTSEDNALVETEADARGAHVPLLKAAKRQYQRAAELGLLDADDSQIVRTYHHPGETMLAAWYERQGPAAEVLRGRRDARSPIPDRARSRPPDRVGHQPRRHEEARRLGRLRDAVSARRSRTATARASIDAVGDGVAAAGSESASGSTAPSPTGPSARPRN